MQEATISADLRARIRLSQATDLTRSLVGHARDRDTLVAAAQLAADECGVDTDAIIARIEDSRRQVAASLAQTLRIQARIGQCITALAA